MICITCVAAGKANTIGDIRSAQILHAQCIENNIECDCQHKTGAGHVRLSYTKA